MRKLVRICEVEGVEYLAFVDWALRHRIGRRAGRRFPSDDRKPVQSFSSPGPSAILDLRGEKAGKPQLLSDDRKPLQSSSSALRGRIEPMDDEAVTRYRVLRKKRAAPFAGNDAVTASRSFDRVRHTAFPARCEMPYARMQGS